MPEQTYNNFIQTIDSTTKDQITSVYLIHGDEYLVKNAFKKLRSFLLPEKKHKTNVNPIDGATDQIPNAIEQMNTFSLMPGTRIIAIMDSQIFYASQDRSALLEKIYAAASDNQMKKASKFFLNLLAAEKLTANAISSERLNETIQKLTKDQDDSLQHVEWLKTVSDYCINQQLKVPDLMDYPELLNESIKKGFAPRNILIITTDTVHKSRRLYKTILEKGTVVQCQIPKGYIKADKEQQEKAFRENAKNILTQQNKSISPDAFATMRQMIEPGLREFTTSLEKLIQYVGDRPQITREDVESVLERSRQDPIFELTSALAERNLIDALAVLDNLIVNQFNPLQALATIANQMRRLLLIIDVRERYKDQYYKGISFNHFKNQFFPNVLEYDQLLAKESLAESALQVKSSKRKKKADTTLMIAKNPKSIYPVYSSFKASEKYSRQELMDAISIIYQADKRIKTGSQDNARVIEQAIIEICRRK